MLSISIGTIGMLSRVSTASALLSRHTSSLGWSRRRALDSDERGISSISTNPNKYAFSGEQPAWLNTPGEPADISQWDTRGTTDMGAVFEDSEFTGDIRTWDVSATQPLVQTDEPDLPPTPFDVDTTKWELSNLKHAEVQAQQMKPPTTDFPPSFPAP